MSETFNKLAARKELGAILYRLADNALDAALRRRIIKRHLATLAETLPVAKFGNIIITMQDANLLENVDEVREGVHLLQSLIPTTYGCIPAGTAFSLPGCYKVGIKRKNGIELPGKAAFAKHLEADEVITLWNLS